jgi:ADP-ribose pyrophosphatase YjhB (NUDIX family)
MKYCSECGETVQQQIPEGDDRMRYICSACETIHYQNPKIVVGTLPFVDEQVLLCRRAIEPRKGFWTLPAGFMENGETTVAGALRESWEEARATIEQPVLYRMFDLPYINQVYIFYRGQLQNGKFDCGPESLECRLFKQSEIPWSEIAFPVVSKTLQEYFTDREQGVFPVRVSDVEPRWQRSDKA